MQPNRSGDRSWKNLIGSSWSPWANVPTSPAIGPVIRDSADGCRLGWTKPPERWPWLPKSSAPGPPRSTNTCPAFLPTAVSKPCWRYGAFQVIALGCVLPDRCATAGIRACALAIVGTHCGAPVWVAYATR